MSVRLEEVGAGPELRRWVRGEEDLQRQRAARRLVGDLRENKFIEVEICNAGLSLNLESLLPFRYLGLFLNR